MDTFKIKAVLTAIKLGSLSKAAEEISYTPSAFSRMLTSLEEELGISVLTRSSNGVKLSEAGKALYPHFVSLVKEEEALLEAAKDFNSKADHTLCVATYPSISRNLLSKTIKDFHALYQNIKLSIKVIDDPTGILENGEADIIFADGNKNNFDLDNLIMIKRGLKLTLGKNDLFSSNANITKTGVLVANLMQKKCNILKYNRW